MRAKRSKDTRLMDKFCKHREDLAAESRLHQPVSSSAAEEDSTLGTGREEDELKVRIW